MSVENATSIISLPSSPATGGGSPTGSRTVADVYTKLCPFTPYTSTKEKLLQDPQLAKLNAQRKEFMRLRKQLNDFFNDHTVDSKAYCTLLESVYRPVYRMEAELPNTYNHSFRELKELFTGSMHLKGEVSIDSAMTTRFLLLSETLSAGTKAYNNSQSCGHLDFFVWRYHTMYQS